MIKFGKSIPCEHQLCYAHGIHLAACDALYGKNATVISDTTYGRGTLQSRSHDCLIGSHECLLLFTPYVAVSDFIICSVLVLRCCECVCCMEFLVKG